MTSAVLEIGSAPNAMSAYATGAGRPQDPVLSSWERGGSGAATRDELLSAARAKLNRLTHLREGWDGHRASTMGLLPVMVLNGVLGSLVRDDQPTPQIAPMADGGVQVAWLVNGQSVEVEVSPEGQVVVFAYDDETGEYSIDDEFEYNSPDLMVIRAAREKLDRLASDVRVRLTGV